MEKYIFKELLIKSINEGDSESDLIIRFIDRDRIYMIIIYDDHCSFQRCDGGYQNIFLSEAKYAKLQA